MKKLIIFDLDGTLNISKTSPNKKMLTLICKLLNKTKVAVISGASFGQFEKQFLKNLGCADDKLARLFILSTSGSGLYKYEENSWTQLYENPISKNDKEKIRQAIKLAVLKADIPVAKHLYGEIIEDRADQLTYSALGQEAPVELKKRWDPDHKKRSKIIKALLPHILGFEARIGGTTSIDITKKGIDKAYGVKKIGKFLNISKNDMLFVGNAIFPGGNDYSVKEAGIETVQTSGPKETEEIIDKLILATDN